MGLRDKIQSALTRAYAGSLGDAVSTFTLRKAILTGSYDSANDTYTPVYRSIESKGVFASYGTDEVDGDNVKSEDEKVIINAVDLSVRPDQDDDLVLSGGQEYRIIKVTPVMGGDSLPIIYIVQARKNVNKNV